MTEFKNRDLVLVTEWSKHFSYPTLKHTVETVRVRTEVQNNQLELVKNLDTHSFSDEKLLPYNKFLKKIAKRTNIPVQVLHKSFVKFDSEKCKLTDENFTEYFADKLIQDCCDNWKKNAISKYSYQKLDNVKKRETALTYSNGKVKESVTKADVGVKLLDNYDVPSTFLYDEPLYDSELEKKNLLSSKSINKIEVFGKIPRRSIKIPTYFGETYSPDFMYVIRKKDGSTKYLNCIIETKGVDSDDAKRANETRKIECAKKFYAKLQEDFKDSNIQIVYKEQQNSDSIAGIIEELLSKS